MPGERVVSEQVLGSSNPIARFGRTVSNSVGGIFFGLVLIAGAFGLVWFGEQQQEHSATVAALPLVTSVPVGYSGMVKVQASPVVTQQLTAPIVQQPVLYFEHRQEEYKKVQETRTETRVVQRDGQDVQQTIEKDVLVDKWVTVSTDKQWAGFSIGGVQVQGAQASLSYLELKKLYEKETPVAGAMEGAVTKRREIVTGIPAATTLLVVGDVAGSAVAGGEPFLISDRSNDALVAAMKTSESRWYWGLKIAAWLVLTIGFVMLFGPIAALLNILPGLGKLFNGVLFIVFGVVSAILVALGTVVIRYWWAVLIVLIALGVFAVKKSKSGGAQKQAA